MLRAFAVACVSLLVAGRGVDASLATGTPPSLYDYDYNGLTTYCYWIKQGMNITSFDYSYVKMEGKGSQCPVLISLAQTTTGTIYAGADVEYQFTVSLNFNDNSFGMKGLEATVLDPSTKRPVHIGHSNLHACSRTTVCDVFRDGANRRISAQETSNFTDEKALFTQRVNFARAGEYNVFAHVIVPPKNAALETYQFVTFTTTTVSSLDGTSGGGSPGKSTTSSASSEGMSTGATIGIIIGAVAALLALVMGVIFYRRKSPAKMMTPGNDHFRNSHTTKNSKQDWNGDPEFQLGHDRYQNSMVSEYNKQPPGLNASALMFQDNNRASRQTKQQKTVSSSGSSNRSGGSPRHRGLGGGGGTNGYGGSRKSTKSAIQLPDHGIGTYETYYNKEPSYEYHNNDLNSFKSEGSVGTTMHGYPNVAHAYAANATKGYGNGGGGGGGSRRGYDHPLHLLPHPPPIYESSGNAYPYDRESDLSSLHDDGDRYDHFDHHGLGPVAEMDRDSDASMGTVDFALPPPRAGSAFRPPGDSFRAEDVPNLADTKLAFNDEEVSKQTIEYIASLRNQNYRDTEQASDYASDFGSTLRTYDFRDSSQSDQVYGANSFRSSSSSTGVDTVPRAVAKKRTPSADSESYEF